MDTQLTDLWNTVLNDLHAKVSQGVFAGFLKPTSLISLKENTATIAVPSPIARNMLQQRFTSEIKKLLESHTQKNISVAYVVKSAPVKQKRNEGGNGPLFATEQLTDTKQLGSDVVKNTPGRPLVGHLPRVRPDYTFENFAVSESNRLAFVSSTTVAKHIGSLYNPFFIYGPVGVGKTHLMHAIANEAYIHDPDKKVVYITSEEFTNEVVEAIKNNETAKMKRRFRSANILLIDDVQFIEGKEKVQEELFHTFNILVDNGSQICLTSDRPPQEIKRLEKRLSSRFAGGLTVDISEPDLELKTAIVKKKAEKYGRVLPIDVALFLAENAQDTRSLEGLLNRLITQVQPQDGELTLETAKKIFNGVVEEKSTHIHADDVINEVCNFYQVKATQIRGPKRDAGLVKARQVIMYLLYERLQLTHVVIGNLLGGRDHTTIMHGVNKMRTLVENKAQISEDILGISKLIFG